ncbi:hypothetical protein JCM3766R1_007100 [Sporobolomyces carnicolor]
MYNAEATVVYGLTVRAVDLIFAAEAWTRLESTFRFFDLVFLRRRKGGLVTGDRGGGGERAISRVPNEVWEEIRYQLVQDEIEPSQADLLATVSCGRSNCDLWLEERCTWDLLVTDGCFVCWENLADWVSENLNVWFLSHVGQVTTVVNAFGLASPFSQPLKLRPSEFRFNDGVALLAAPASFKEANSDAPIVTAESGGDEVADESTIVDISFDGLPLDIDSRFKRFVELFNLEVVDSSVETISPCSRREGLKVARRAKRSASSSPPHGLRECATFEVKPKWRLCVQSHAGG